MRKEKLKIAIALGSGGAKGFAHIGALQVLEENKIPISCITGCSMGAIIGGAYAAGISLKAMIAYAKKLKMFNIIDIPLISKYGFLRGAKAENALIKFFTKNKASTTFENCKIPFACGATDILEGKTAYLKEGSLIEAIRASFSITGVFVPVEKDGMLLMDGGPLCRVPVRLARELGADKVVAIDCVGRTKTISAGDIKSYGDTLERIMYVMDYAIGKEEINEADIIIEPSQDDVSGIKLDGLLDSINAGREAMKKAIPQIKEWLKNK
ncbi:MAG: patatin-like phospholipase family protein [Clostridia bacterium]